MTKPPSQRQLRVGELIRHALSELLARGEVQDPDLDGRVITVSEVTVSPDLKSATAYVVPLGGGGQAAVVAALIRARRFIRGEIARRVVLRYAPEIRFEADTSFAQSEAVRELLASPTVARDLKPGEGD